MTDKQDIIWTLETLREHREEIVHLAERYGASNVRVFGSVARGETDENSDVDLLVTVRDGVSIFDLVGLWLDLQDLLKTEVSLVTDDDHPRKQRFFSQIYQDAVPL